MSQPFLSVAGINFGRIKTHNAKPRLGGRVGSGAANPFGCSSDRKCESRRGAVANFVFGRHSDQGSVALTCFLPLAVTADQSNLACVPVLADGEQRSAKSSDQREPVRGLSEARGGIQPELTRKRDVESDSCGARDFGSDGRSGEDGLRRVCMCCKADLPASIIDPLTGLIVWTIAATVIGLILVWGVGSRL